MHVANEYTHMSRNYLAHFAHTGDPVEILELPTEEGRGPLSERGRFPFEKKAKQNGDHNLGIFMTVVQKDCVDASS